MEFQQKLPVGTQWISRDVPPASTQLLHATGMPLEFLQYTSPMHTGLVDHTNLTLPAGTDAYIPARHDTQPVCARLQPISGVQGYAAAGIADCFSSNTQPLADSYSTRPGSMQIEGYEIALGLRPSFYRRKPLLQLRYLLSFRLR